MFSALKKFAKGNDDRCPAPTPMASSLQKKFSRGVNYNMKILIKGDRNVGKSCLLQRLQGGQFIEEYTPTEQIQVAPIHWTYKNTEHVVKVEVWEVVDKGKAKKKSPLGLKLENQCAPTNDDVGYDIPVLDATFLDVYKTATGLILMFDITKPWTFDYVVKELSRVPPDLPVLILGNHCDMQHHRQVHPHHTDQAMYQAKISRPGPVRYAESSMRNGFGLRLLHQFLSVPFLRLQQTSLLEQLQRNQKEIEEVETDIDDYQRSEESQYSLFIDRLTNKRRQNTEQLGTHTASDKSPSIVLGGGKPIIPTNINPLLAQSLNPLGIKAQYASPSEVQQTKQQTEYVNPELLKAKHKVKMDKSLTKPSPDSNLTHLKNTTLSPLTNDLDEFYAGALDNSFLEDLPQLCNTNPDVCYDSDSDNSNIGNPLVTNEEDDLEIDHQTRSSNHHKSRKPKSESFKEETSISSSFASRLSIKDDNIELEINMLDKERENIECYPIWNQDASVRRSPEGGEDPGSIEVTQKKVEKKYKKKKSKDKAKEKGDYSDKSEKKERKHKHKKAKSDKRESHPQQNLLLPESEDYDSL